MDKEAVRFLPTELLIGVEEIDIQHAALFKRLVALKEGYLANQGFHAAQADELIAALREHYATEERLAGEIGMDFSAHAENHRNMLQLVGKALNEVAEGRADLFGTLRYVEYWFERHIAQDDMCLGAAPARPVVAREI